MLFTIDSKMFHSHSRWFAFALLTAAALVAAGCSKEIGDPLPDVAAATKIREGLAKAGGPGAVAAGPTETWSEEKGRASLKGVIKVQGTVELKPLSATKDPNVCDASPPNQQFVVDSASGGLRDAVIFIDGIQDDWCDAAAKPGKADPVLFDQKACIFLTHVLAVQQTQLLQIKNSDGVDHNANLTPKANKPENFLIPPGATKPYQPTEQEAQPFTVSCTIHPWMNAWILTRKNGYFAVTGPNGEFSIPNLPADVTLKVRVWQERAKFFKAGLLASPAEGGKWTGTTFELKLKKGEDQTVQFVVDASKLPN